MKYLYEILMKDGNSWKFMEMTECIQNRGNILNTLHVTKIKMVKSIKARYDPSKQSKH